VNTTWWLPAGTRTPRKAWSTPSRSRAGQPHVEGPSTFNILGLRWVGSSTHRITIAFGFIGAATSPFLSNTGAAAMMLPIALDIMASVGRLIVNQVEGEDRPERLRFGAALMLVITYGITVGGLLLPIGSPPNLIGRGLLEDETGEPITFFEWFLTALPIVLVMFIALLAVILFLNRPEVKRVEGAEEFIAEEKRKLGPVSAGERNTLIAFGVAIVLWTLPGLVGLFLGDDSSLYESLTDRWLDEGVVAIIAAVQVDPTIPALAAIFGANYGFMLPVSTPPNAIVYSSGMLPSPTWSGPAPCSTPSAPSSAWSGWPSWPTWSAWSSRSSGPGAAGPGRPSAGAGPAAPAWP
jgi:di/tricarboxylate transporter